MLKHTPLEPGRYLYRFTIAGQVLETAVPEELYGGGKMFGDELVQRVDE